MFSFCLWFQKVQWLLQNPSARFARRALLAHRPAKNSLATCQRVRFGRQEPSVENSVEFCNSHHTSLDSPNKVFAEAINRASKRRPLDGLGPYLADLFRQAEWSNRLTSETLSWLGRRGYCPGPCRRVAWARVQEPAGVHRIGGPRTIGAQQPRPPRRAARRARR